MKKLNVAIIGQGRSGKNIHGAFLRSEANLWFDVKYVVDADEFRKLWYCPVTLLRSIALMKLIYRSSFMRMNVRQH